METFVISLQRRPDRRELFENTNNIKYQIVDAVDGHQINHQWLLNNGFDTDKDWVDPINNTHITHGEVACYMSHYGLWERCIKLNKPIIILEDDAIVTERFSIKEIEDVIARRGYNFLYLGYREMGTSREIDDKFVKPDYPYWTVGYVVTPEAAQLLISNKKGIIPVDEYLPLMMNKLKPIGYKENVVDPWDRSVGGTDVDPVDRYQYFLDFVPHAITVGSDDSKCERLHDSAMRHNMWVNNIGKNVEWKGSNMSGPGGGQKINLLRSHIQNLPDHDVILFMDGYDVFVNDITEEILRRYLEFKCKVLFAAEEWCWPDESLAEQFPDGQTKYRYLNSGLIIGRVDELKKILDQPIEDYEDDQLYYQKQFLSGKFDIQLDYECYIFQCHDTTVGSNRASEFNPGSKNQLTNMITQCCPCIYHGNGDEEAKKHFNELYNVFFAGPITYITTHDYEILDKDMLLVDFMTPQMCDDLIELADKHGGWGSLSYDKFPAQEIRYRELNLWIEMEKHWEKHLYPIIEKYWYPMEMYGMRDAFVMRYAMDTQRKLNLHTDASLVTGSVKLNDDYEGADLVFPRQGISNKDIPVGKCILFPGTVTHGHACTELQSGVKYSLTMWSSRYPGDVV